MIARQKARLSRDQEAGQALVLFAFSLIVLFGFVALSIDVGRYVWARTQMQAAVDSAALAAAQSMPSGTVEAEEWADYFWEDNNDFLENNSENLDFAISYPAVGNRRVHIRGDADIPTWFARIFGVDSWHVSAEGDAESQVLDIAVVLDISGSMCMTSYPRTEGGDSIYLMSPGRLTPAGGYTFPKLDEAISASTGDSIVIKLNDVGIFTSTSSTKNKSNFGKDWESSTPYWQKDPDGGGGGNPARSGMIRIGTELFRITAADTVHNTLTVSRAQNDNYLGVPTVKQAHSIGDEIWALRHAGAHGENDNNDYCNSVSYYTASTSQNGPHQPFDSAISNAQYFVGLFNDGYDKIGVATYSTSGDNVSSLTSNFSSLTSAMNGILFPTGGTNIADGIAQGRHILNGDGKRTNAVRVMVVLTDGVPTNYCAGGYDEDDDCDAKSTTAPTSCGGSPSTSVTHARNQATQAATEDITVYWIGLGDGVLDCLLQDLADRGTGDYIPAPTVADLDDAFKEIAEKTHIALIN